MTRTFQPRANQVSTTVGMGTENSTAAEQPQPTHEKKQFLFLGIYQVTEWGEREGVIACVCV